MSLPQLSVARPVFVAMMTLIVVTLGVAGLLRLRVDLLPEIELPTLSVRTQYEGASPEVMEALVTQIMEEIVATVPGVEEIVSSSSEGNSEVTVTFGWGTDVNVAAQDVRARIEDELGELPEDVQRPQLRKFDVNSFPVLLLGIASDLDPVALTAVIERHVRGRLSRMAGVAQVDVWGGFERELRVEIHPQQLAALAISLDEVVTALRRANVDLPAGEIDQGRLQRTLRAPAQLIDPAQVRRLIVATRDGAPITLAQLATVRDTHKRFSQLIRVNGQRGIRVAIRKQADANTVEVAQAVLAEVEALNAELPHIHIASMLNQGNFIERSIANVARSVLYGGALALLILFLFLLNLRSTLIIGLSIPISMLATFALMEGLGLTLNLMTLGGLALGAGMMVDNAIVVLENIARWRGGGAGWREAAEAGGGEVASAILASTLTTLVIFLPIVFMEGVSGQLFREMAYVISFALFTSLLVALSVVPALAARQGRGARPQAPSRLSQRGAALYDRLAAAYKAQLQGALRRRGLIVLGAAALSLASFLLMSTLGAEFMPPSDEGAVQVWGEMETGVRLDRLDEMTRRVEAVVAAAVPEAEAAMTNVGDNGRRPERAAQGRVEISLVPATQRARSNTAIANDLRRRLEGQIPGMKIRARAPQGQFLLERLFGGEEGLRVEIRGFELAVLDGLAARAAEALEGVGGITDVTLARGRRVPQTRFDIHRAKAASLGVPVAQIAETLQTAMAGRGAGVYRTGGEAYRIWVQLADPRQRSVEDILALPLRTPSGAWITLGDVVTPRPDMGPMRIDRKDQQRVTRVEANIAERDIGSVAADARAALAAIPRPVGYEIRLGGQLEAQEEAFEALLWALILAIALVYMVLAAQYESLIDPLIVMLSVPVASVGVFLALWLTRTTLNAQSYIGCVMLGGIVVNNAILLVDQAGQLRRQGVEATAAIIEAGQRRLRPILMTTSTTILGLLPLAFGVGEGADAQAPLARAVVGGLLGSTLITLALIPAIYSLVYARRDRRVGTNV